MFGKLAGFFRDEAGNYAVIAGLVTFPIMGATALAVDYSNFERQRVYVQASLDAAALATAKEYAAGAIAGDTQAETQANLTAYAKNYFEANIEDRVSLSKLTFTAEIETEIKEDAQGADFEEKSIGLKSRLEYDTSFAKVIGHEKMLADITASVAMGNLTVEVALVMDNSGSMSSNSRLVRAKSTAKDLVDKLYAASAFSNKPDPVSFSVVPFASSVNIGSGNANKPWMDINGWAPIHHENLDWSTYIKPSNATVEITDKGSHKIVREKIGSGAWAWKTRLNIYSMLNESWDGCVEMRPWPHSVQDTVQQLTGLTYEQAVSGNGDGLDALFVPMFAPSEPSATYTTKSGSSWISNTDWYNYPNDYTYDYRKADNVIFASTSADRQANQNVRQNWIWRYQNSNVSMSSSRHPNSSCTTTALTPLTTNKTTVKTAIDAMAANGNTNVHEGIAWGWRTLSAAEPFTGGRAREEIDNRKYIIALTDGNNTYGTSSTPNETTYGAWGYGKFDRIEGGLSGSDLPALYAGQSFTTYEKKMNVHTLQTCENAREAGITIFTIAFDVPDGSSVKSLLDACGGSGEDLNGDEIFTSGQFYFDVNGAEIEAAMDSIASQISQMRLKR